MLNFICGFLKAVKLKCFYIRSFVVFLVYSLKKELIVCAFYKDLVGRVSEVSWVIRFFFREVSWSLEG